MRQYFLSFLTTIYLWGALIIGQLNAQYDLARSIHPLESAKEHYAELQKYDLSPTTELRHVDTISFDRNRYNNRSILYSLIEPAYLTKDQVRFFTNTVHPPANSSVQTKMELEFLLDLQKNRTPETIERVIDLAKIGYWPDIDQMKNHLQYDQNEEYLMFECSEVLGSPCTSTAYPNTAKLLKHVMNDTRLMEYSMKYTHLRPRPYQLESQLEPLEVMSTPSFASGHTLWAYIQAFTWSELLPSKRQAFLDLAFEIGMSREIMGIHYPSDEEAARNIAHRMLYLMWHNDTFQKDFQAAKQEWNHMEDESGWISLLDKSHSSLWRGYNSTTLPPGWIIENGEMYFDKSMSKDESYKGGRDVIYAGEEFENFELSIEWKIPPGGNSGILYHVQEGHGGPAEVAPEYQLIDDENYASIHNLTSYNSQFGAKEPAKLQDWQMTAADYAMYTPDPSIKKLHPAGEWNHTKIIFTPERVEHWLNGNLVLSFVPWSDDWNERKNSGKWKDHPLYGTFKSGYLALQDHGNSLWFRNIKVKKL